MANKNKYTPSEVIRAIREIGGSLSMLAGYLDVTEQTVRNYAKRYKKVQAALDVARTDRRAMMFSLAEDGLHMALLKQEWKAIQFVLSTLGKEFYSNRTEMTGADGQPFIPISEEAARMLAEMGIDPETASDVFNRMIAAQATMVEVEEDD